jgi:hypothetical protein
MGRKKKCIQYILGDSLTNSIYTYMLSKRHLELFSLECGFDLAARERETSECKKILLTIELLKKKKPKNK